MSKVTQKDKHGMYLYVGINCKVKDDHTTAKTELKTLRNKEGSRDMHRSI